MSDLLVNADSSSLATDASTRPAMGAADHRMASILSCLIAERGWRFCAGGEPVAPELISGPEHMLPAIMWQVEKLHRQAYGGVSAGIAYAPADDHVLGVQAVFPHSAPSSKLVLFAYEVFQSAIDRHLAPDGTASLDQVMREFYEDRQMGLLPMTAQPQQDLSLSRNRPEARAV